MIKKEILAIKEDLAATLRAHQAAVDATKSPQRDAAEGCYRNSLFQQISFYLVNENETHGYQVKSEKHPDASQFYVAFPNAINSVSLLNHP